MRSKYLLSRQLFLLSATTEKCLEHVPHSNHSQNSKNCIGLLLRLLLTLAATCNGSLLSRHLVYVLLHQYRLSLLSTKLRNDLAI